MLMKLILQNELGCSENVMQGPRAVECTDSVASRGLMVPSKAKFAVSIKIYSLTCSGGGKRP